MPEPYSKARFIRFFISFMFGALRVSAELEGVRCRGKNSVYGGKDALCKCIYAVAYAFHSDSLFHSCTINLNRVRRSWPGNASDPRVAAACWVRSAPAHISLIYSARYLTSTYSSSSISPNSTRHAMVIRSLYACRRTRSVSTS